MKQLVPNETTDAAMEEQDLPSFESIDDLMADLNADDQATHTGRRCPDEHIDLADSDD